MRVLVCGSRTWRDQFEDPYGDQYRLIPIILSGIAEWSDCHGQDDREAMVVIEGGARGADQEAWAWANDDELETGLFCGCQAAHIQFPADWDRYGKRAGYVRNQQMLEEGKPDLVLAFVDKPLQESRGTAMMVDLARKAGVPTYVIEKIV